MIAPAGRVPGVHTSHDRAVREHEDTLEASLHNGEVPRTCGDRADRFEPLLGDDATKVPHWHRVLTRDAAASECHAPLAGGVDLIDYTFVVAGRMRTNAPRLTHPTSEQRGRLLTPETAGSETYGQAEGAASKSNGQRWPPLGVRSLTNCAGRRADQPTGRTAPALPQVNRPCNTLPEKPGARGAS